MYNDSVWIDINGGQKIQRVSQRHRDGTWWENDIIWERKGKTWDFRKGTGWHECPTERSAELEAEYQERERVSEARRAEWRMAIIESLAAEENRRGYPILTGNDDAEPFGPDDFGLEPPDAYHETGAATLG